MLHHVYQHLLLGSLMVLPSYDQSRQSQLLYFQNVHPKLKRLLLMIPLYLILLSMLHNPHSLLLISMKMVAAAKVKKCENAVKASRPFTKELNAMLQKLLLGVKSYPEDFSKPSKPIKNW